MQDRSSGLKPTVHAVCYALPWPCVGQQRTRATLCLAYSAGLPGVHTALHMAPAGEGIGQEENGPDALFRLATIKGARAAERVGEAAVPHQEDAAADSPSSSDSGDDPADEDSDDARRSVLAQLLGWACTGPWRSKAVACHHRLVRASVHGECPHDRAFCFVQECFAANSRPAHSVLSQCARHRGRAQFEG